MSEHEKSTAELFEELAALRRAVESSEVERRRMEGELSRERSRVQEYVDIAAVILVVLDEHANIEFLNRKGREILEWDDEEPVGKNWFDHCLPEPDRQRVAETFHRLMAGDVEETASVENPILTRSGEQRIIAWHNTILTDESGRRVGTLSSGTDITQRKLAEEALQNAHDDLERRVDQRTAALSLANQQLEAEIDERTQTQDQLRAIYDGMVDGLLIANVATKRFARANRAASRMLGYSREELMSMSVTDIHPADTLPDVLETFRALAERKISAAENIPMLRKDGSVFYADVSSSPSRYDGEDCIIGFFRDVTERRKSQEALEKEHRVLRQLLESHDRERQLVAYEIHDGLAQQLAGAIMHLQAAIQMKDSGANVLAEVCDAGIETLRQCLAEARRLMSGLRPPVLDESGIAAAVEDLVEESNARGGPKVEFHREIQFDRLEPLLENAVYRIIQECLTNAKRYSQSDRVRIELVQEEGRIRVTSTDWGIGFDPATVREGSFGLEGIRERSRLLGGHALITSAPGKGTQVVVELPITTVE